MPIRAVDFKSTMYTVPSSRGSYLLSNATLIYCNLVRHEGIEPPLAGNLPERLYKCPLRPTRWRSP